MLTQSVCCLPFSRKTQLFFHPVTSSKETTSFRSATCIYKPEILKSSITVRNPRGEGISSKTRHQATTASLKTQCQPWFSSNRKTRRWSGPGGGKWFPWTFAPSLFPWKPWRHSLYRNTTAWSRFSKGFINHVSKEWTRDQNLRPTTNAIKELLVCRSHHAAWKKSDLFATTSVVDWTDVMSSITEISNN